jgi:hypothetical protein
MIIYGLFGFTHGGAKVLTVMSPEGASAALRSIAGVEDVIIDAGEGRLTSYLEKRRGALARLIEAHGIIVLNKAEWDAKKAGLGAAVLG